MFPDLIKTCNDQVKHIRSESDLEGLSKFMQAAQKECARIEFNKHTDLPYGRYLVHQNEHYNIQLDVFSHNYTGDVHCHETWGLLTILKGSLYVEDWIEDAESFTLQRSSFLTRNSSQCFYPPLSDWHKVATGDDPQQTISIHIYGPDFNIDQGIYLNSDLQRRSGQRSPFKSLDKLTGSYTINP